MQSAIKDPKFVAINFNEYINARNIDRLTGLMTEDHVFIDTGGNRIIGKENCKKAWIGFFNAFPDYQNIFEKLNSNENLVLIQGYSRCSDKRLDGSAIWTARIVDDQIVQWRVYEDTVENRIMLKL